LSLRFDYLDSQIVQLLQEDGRMLYKDIAVKVGVSLPTVKARIRRLMDLGVIKKFTVVVDSNRIAGKIRAMVLAKLRGDASDGVADRLLRIDGVRAAHFVSGERQVFLEIEADNPEEYNRLVLQRLPGEAGLTDIATYIVTDTIKEEYGVSLKPNSFLQFNCSFCGCLIYGKPIVKHYYGGKYYFSGEECAEAYKKILDEKYRSKKKAEDAG
jgi:Lrp/AsnC family transcriptional regulator for asnA, asnC and gidA